MKLLRLVARWAVVILFLCEAAPATVISQGSSSAQSAHPPSQGTTVTEQWFLERIGAPAPAADAATSVIVAVIDDGVDSTAPQLTGQFVGIINIVAPDSVRDTSGHGTHTAALIAARPGPNGIRGVCLVCRLLVIKAITNHGYGSDATVARAVDLAVEHGARVINLSIGSTADTPILRRAIANAIAHDIVVVAAAGNNPQRQRPYYPAAYPGVIAVGAVDVSNQLAVFASRGTYIDIVAPGVDILSLDTSPRGFGSATGTSTAAPLVSAAAGILRAAYPAASAPMIRAALLAGVTDLGPPGRDTTYGAGLLNIPQARAAMQRRHTRAVAQ